MYLDAHPRMAPWLCQWIIHIINIFLHFWKELTERLSALWLSERQMYPPVDVVIGLITAPWYYVKIFVFANCNFSFNTMPWVRGVRKRELPLV